MPPHHASPRAYRGNAPPPSSSPRTFRRVASPPVRIMVPLPGIRRPLCRVFFRIPDFLRSFLFVRIVHHDVDSSARALSENFPRLRQEGEVIPSRVPHTLSALLDAADRLLTPGHKIRAVHGIPPTHAYPLLSFRRQTGRTDHCQAARGVRTVTSPPTQNLPGGSTRSPARSRSTRRHPKSRTIRRAAGSRSPRGWPPRGWRGGTPATWGASARLPAGPRGARNPLTRPFLPRNEIPSP